MVWAGLDRGHLCGALVAAARTRSRSSLVRCTRSSLVLAAQGLVFWWTGLYKGLWRFASLPGPVEHRARRRRWARCRIAITLFLYNRLVTVPRAVLVIYPAVLAVFLGAPRLLYRYWKDSAGSTSSRAAAGQRARARARRRASAGEALVRDLKRENQLSRRSASSTTTRSCAARSCTACRCSARSNARSKSPAKPPPHAADRDAVGEQRADAPHRRTVRIDRDLPFRTRAAPGRRRLRPLAVQRTQRGRDRGSARPRSGAARLDR